MALCFSYFGFICKDFLQRRIFRRIYRELIEVFSRRITPFMPLPSPDLFSGGKTGGMPESFFSEREFFSSGRAALARAVALLNPDSSSKVFLPYFFCPQIREMLKKKYSVAYYEDLPSEREPRFSSLKARSGDIVVAVNFFGLRRREAWDKWKSENPGLILIEDHSHAPFSARQSAPPHSSRSGTPPHNFRRTAPLRAAV